MDENQELTSGSDPLDEVTGLMGNIDDDPEDVNEDSDEEETDEEGLLEDEVSPAIQQQLQEDPAEEDVHPRVQAPAGYTEAEITQMAYDSGQSEDQVRLQIIISQRAARDNYSYMSQADQVSAAYFAREASEAPDFYHKHEVGIRALMPGLPDNMKGTREGVQYATILYLMSKAKSGESLKTVLGRAVDEMRGAERKSAPAKVATRPMVPSGTQSSGAPSGARRIAESKKPDNKMASLYGLSAAQMRTVQEDPHF